MAKETDENFDYIPGQRYIVEIQDEQTGKSLFSRRFCFLSNAATVRDGCNGHKDLTAQIHDTKTGEILEGDF